jgi:predicted dehydrogenase
LTRERPEASTKHIIQAVGSSSKEKGSAFVAKHAPSSKPSIYSSYAEVYNDPNVEIVYIGTPHSCHLQNALDAISAGKNVLCEKPMTINAKETEILIKAAKERGVFLMEGTSDDDLLMFRTY